MAPAYIVIAYMPPGTTIDGKSFVSREFTAEEVDRNFFLGVPGQFSLGLQTAHMASLILRVNVQDGTTTVLKNRWGPTSKERRERLEPTYNEILDKIEKKVPESNWRFATYPGGIPSKNALIDSLLPVAKMKAKPDPDPKPPGWRLEPIKNPTGPEIPLTPQKAVCRCDMKDLLSTGHVVGCPEKKR